MDTITPDSLRAARAFLNWSMRDLEERSGVARRTIAEIEASNEPGAKPRRVRAATSEKIIKTFAEHGVAFMPLPADGIVRIPVR